MKGRTESLALLARVPTKFDVWPKDIEDYEFSLQTAANIVAPPTSNPHPDPDPDSNPNPNPNLTLTLTLTLTLILTTDPDQVAPPIFTGELVKLDKGNAIDAMIKKHNLRPFLLDVYNVEYKYD